MSPQHHKHVPDVTLMSYKKSKHYAGTTLYNCLQSKIKVLNHNRNTFMPALKHYPLILLHCKWIFSNWKFVLLHDYSETFDTNTLPHFRSVSYDLLT